MKQHNAARLISTWLISCVVICAGCLSAAASGGAVNAEAATFETDDGVTIHADYIAASGDAPATPAILLHMYRHDRTTWQPLIGPLHEAGFAVLAIDMRGHGESSGPADMNLARRVEQRDEAVFQAMHKDVAAALNWIRQQAGVSQENVVLVGASVGCSVAIDFAGREQSVSRVVCMTPGEAYLGLDSTKQIGKTGHAKLLLLATEDERKACDVLSASAENATADIVGAGRVHGTRMFGQIDGIEAKIVAYLGGVEQ